MGDLLGSPRVAPLLLSFQPVNPLFAADPFTFACVSGFRSRARGLRAARTRRGAGKGPRRAELCGGRNSAVKRAWARAVLRWVTSWEVLVLHPSFYLFSRLILFSRPTPSLLRALAGFDRGRGVSGQLGPAGERGKGRGGLNCAAAESGQARGARVNRLILFSRPTPSLLRALAGFDRGRGVSGQLGPAGERGKGRGGLNCAAAESGQNSAVKRAWARAVLRWVTSWEVLVLHPSFYLFSRLILFSRPTPLLLRALAGFDRGRGVSGQLGPAGERGKGRGGLNCAAAESGQNSAVKRAWARAVLRWVTSWEVLVLHPSFYLFSRLILFSRPTPSLLRALAGFDRGRGVSGQLGPAGERGKGRGGLNCAAAESGQNSAVKRAWARAVLRWVTSWEVLVLHPSFYLFSRLILFSRPTPSLLRALAGFDRGRGVSGQLGPARERGKGRGGLNCAAAESGQARGARVNRLILFSRPTPSLLRALAGFDRGRGVSGQLGPAGERGKGRGGLNCAAAESGQNSAVKRAWARAVLRWVTSWEVLVLHPSFYLFSRLILFSRPTPSLLRALAGFDRARGVSGQLGPAGERGKGRGGLNCAAAESGQNSAVKRAWARAVLRWVTSWEVLVLHPSFYLFSRLILFSRPTPSLLRALAGFDRGRGVSGQLGPAGERGKGRGGLNCAAAESGQNSAVKRAWARAVLRWVTSWEVLVLHPSFYLFSRLILFSRPTPSLLRALAGFDRGRGVSGQLGPAGERGKGRGGLNCAAAESGQARGARVNRLILFSRPTPSLLRALAGFDRGRGVSGQLGPAGERGKGRGGLNCAAAESGQARGARVNRLILFSRPTPSLLRALAGFDRGRGVSGQLGPAGERGKGRGGLNCAAAESGQNSAVKRAWARAVLRWVTSWEVLVLHPSFYLFSRLILFSRPTPSLLRALAGFDRGRGVSGQLGPAGERGKGRGGLNCAAAESGQNSAVKRAWARAVLRWVTSWEVLVLHPSFYLFSRLILFSRPTPSLLRALAGFDRGRGVSGQLGPAGERGKGRGGLNCAAAESGQNSAVKRAWARAVLRWVTSWEVLVLHPSFYLFSRLILFSRPTPSLLRALAGFDRGRGVSGQLGPAGERGKGRGGLNCAAAESGQNSAVKRAWARAVLRWVTSWEVLVLHPSFYLFSRLILFSRPTPSLLRALAGFDRGRGVSGQLGPAGERGKGRGGLNCAAAESGQARGARVNRLILFSRPTPSLLRALAGFDRGRGVSGQLGPAGERGKGRGGLNCAAAESGQNSAVKRAWARAVLRWVTSWEVLVLHPSFYLFSRLILFSRPTPSLLRALAGFDRGRGVSGQLGPAGERGKGRGGLNCAAAESGQNSAVKRAWARAVLRWVTSWEVLVLHPSFYLFSRLILFSRPTPSLLRALAGFDRGRGVSGQLGPAGERGKGRGGLNCAAAESGQNSAVKRAWARAVLRWVTSWEVLVLHPSFYLFSRLILFSRPTPSLLRALAGFDRGRGVSGQLGPAGERGKGRGGLNCAAAESGQNSAVKRAWARAVLRWVTSWEVLVLHPSFYLFSRLILFSRPTPSLLRALAGFDRGRGVSGQLGPAGERGKGRGGLNCAAAESGQARGARVK
ncbi:hypothetical protein WN944_003280 [Citrus x changshan-huyou]|uniref:Uncharacterized protein n=1 Tax=Citrus x changshan-huyou TaxID=2935761 RepID=A0AAP0LY71_9ROSI